jgi:3-oxoacyl-[acyl-carrier protein] reductase
LKIDILVNNAGTERQRGLQEIQIEDYDAVYNLNIRGTILLTQSILPYLNAKGRIINLSSVAARAGFANYSLYCSSKAALVRTDLQLFVHPFSALPAERVSVEKRF